MNEIEELEKEVLPIMLATGMVLEGERDGCLYDSPRWLDFKGRLLEATVIGLTRTMERKESPEGTLIEMGVMIEMTLVWMWLEVTGYEGDKKKISMDIAKYLLLQQSRTYEAIELGLLE